MIKSLFKYFIPIAVVISILFGGINALGIADTLHGVRQALLESPGTSIYRSEFITVFVFPRGTNYAFTGLSNAGGVYHLIRTICNANCTDINTITDLLNWLESPRSGFAKATPKDLPLELVNFIMSFRIYMVTIGYGTLPTLWAVPMIVLDGQPLQELQPTGVTQ